MCSNCGQSLLAKFMLSLQLPSAVLVDLGPLQVVVVRVAHCLVLLVVVRVTWRGSIGGEGSGSLLRYVAGGGERWEPCRDTRNDLTDHWEKTRALQMNGQGKS